MPNNIKSKKTIGDLIPKSDGTVELNLSEKFIKTFTSIFGSKTDNLSAKVKSGGRKLGNIDTAKNTSITENQYKRMRRGDGTADVLAHLYVMLKKNNDQLKKQREINNNFKKQREHEKDALYKSFRTKGSSKLKRQRRHDSEESEFNYWTLLGLGIATAVAGLVDIFNIDSETLKSFDEKLTEFNATVDEKIKQAEELAVTLKDDFIAGTKAAIVKAEEFKATATKLYNDFKSEMTTKFEKFKSDMTLNIGKKYDEIMKTVNWVVESGKNLKNLIHGQLLSIGTWAKQMFENPTALFEGGFSDLFNAIGANSSTYNSKQKEIDSKHPEGGVVNAMLEANREIGRGMMATPSKIMEWGKSAYGASTTAGKATLGAGGNAIDWYLEGIKKNFQAKGERIESVTSQFNEGGTIYETAKKIKDNNKDKVMPWTAINEARKLAPKIVVDKASKIANDVSESTRNWVETTSDAPLGNFSQASEVSTEYNKTRMQDLLRQDYTYVWGNTPSAKPVVIDKSSNNAKNMGPNIPTNQQTRNDENSFKKSVGLKSKVAH
jgi:hypothetical protein